MIKVYRYITSVKGDLHKLSFFNIDFYLSSEKLYMFNKVLNGKYF